MKHKLLRALCYLKELLAMLLCKLLGAVCRAFIPAYRDIWLVGERGTDARDNGYWFYRYLRPHLRGHLRSVTGAKGSFTQKVPRCRLAAGDFCYRFK